MSATDSNQRAIEDLQAWEGRRTVTGSTNNIGRAIGLKFAVEGAHTVVNGRTSS
jgi:short-subunit dehydrogenase